MNYRENIIKKFQGVNDGMPLFVPRLDIWYNANRIKGTLPQHLKKLSLMDITEKLGVGYHSVIPDFMSTGRVEDLYHRGLGFYNHPTFPYFADFSNIDFKPEIKDGELKVTYYSHLGEITTGINYSPGFLNSGLSIPDITEHAIKAHDDYRILADILSRVIIKPMPENYAAHYEYIGERGVAVAYLTLAAGPMQHIMRDLMKFEDFIYDLYDAEDVVNQLVEPLSDIHKKIIDSVLQTEAEVALYGGNYDYSITCPPFFNEHISPWLSYAADKMHAAGKLLLTHTDGENKGLNQYYIDCNIDVADSVCPAPMTEIKMNEYRAVFGDDVSIWGGIPSNIMLSSICNDTDFKNHIDTLIDECKPFNNLVFSIADTTPPDTDFDRILYIIERCSNR